MIAGADDRDDRADDEQARDPDRRGDDATQRRPEDRRQPGAAREEALGRAARPDRRARGQDGDAADEDAREPDPLERGDGQQLQRLRGQGRQTGPEGERDRPEHEEPLGPEPLREPREQRT